MREIEHVKELRSILNMPINKIAQHMQLQRRAVEKIAREMEPAE